MKEFREQIVRCLVGACDETCIHYSYDDNNHSYCNSLENGFIDRVNKYFDEINKVKEDLRYYADVNEDLGVVYIPKFAIEKMIKKL